MQNLVGNAIKFRREGEPPRVSISGKRAGSTLVLSIRDQGIGIDPRHHTRIFEVFKRIHPKRFPGTGIGLSICQRIAERHGVTIRLESALGQGSTFHITLATYEGP